MRHLAVDQPATARPAATLDPDPVVELGPGASLDDLLAEAHRQYGNAAVAQLLAAGGARALARPGGPLPHQALLEARFGVELGDVRAHTDPASQAGVRATGAEALTRGADVAFASASPSVETAAHEVAHVLQRRGAGPVAGVDTLEAQADDVAAQVARGDGPVDVAGLAAGGDRLLGKGLAAQVQAIIGELGGDDGVGVEVAVARRHGDDPHAAHADWRRRDSVDAAMVDIDDALGALDGANRRLARATRARAALPAADAAELDGVAALHRRVLDGAVAKAQAEVEAAAARAQEVVAHGVTLPPPTARAAWREASQVRSRERLQLAEDRLSVLCETSREAMLASGADVERLDLRLGKGVTLGRTTSRARERYAADGDGARAGGRDAEPADTERRSLEGEVGVLLDADTTGARAGIAGDAAWGADGAEVSLRPGIDGGYAVTVQRVGAGVPALFDLTIAFSLGGTLGVGGGRGDVGVSGAVTAGAQLVQRRRLTADELGGYAAALDRVEAGAAPGIAAFELDLLRAQLAQEGAEALAARAGALLRDPGSVATMAPHELVSLSTTIGAEGEVEASRGGRGGAASAELAVTRTVTIERLAGAPRDGGGCSQPVRLTVGFAEDGELHGEAQGRHAGAEVELARGDAQTAVFELDASDPDYGRVFDELTTARSRAALTAVAARPANAAYLRRSTRARHEALTTGMTFGGGLGLEVGRSTDFAEAQTLTYDRGAVVGAEGGYAGSSGYAAGLEVLGVTIADGRQRDHAEAGYGADGPTLRVGEETEARSFAPWDNQATLREALATEHPVEALLLARRANAHGVELGPADVARLIQRASDRRTWAAAVYPVDPQLAPAWEELRQALAHPTPDARLVAIDPDVARQAARGRAVAEFMAASRGKGYDVMRRVLDGGGAPAIGTAFEWPSELGMAKVEYERACAQFEADGPAGASAPAIRTLLEHVLYRVEGTTFETPRAKVSLIESIQTMLAALGATVAAPDQRVEVLLATLTAAKQEETRTIAAARDLAGAARSDDLATYDDATSDLEDLDKLWIPRILELRELWAATHADDRDLPVSTGPGAPRNLALEPDAAARERLYAARSRRAVVPDYRYDLHAQVRRSRADRY